MNKDKAKQLRDRRLLHPVPVCKSSQLFDLPSDFSLRNLILEWISEYTIGEFYISSTVLYFCNEQDAMSFILHNIKEKYVAFNLLKSK